MRSIAWLKGFIAHEMLKDDTNPNALYTDDWEQWKNGWWSAYCGIEIND